MPGAIDFDEMTKNSVLMCFWWGSNRVVVLVLCCCFLHSGYLYGEPFIYIADLVELESGLIRIFKWEGIKKQFFIVDFYTHYKRIDHVIIPKPHFQAIKV